MRAESGGKRTGPDGEWFLSAAQIESTAHRSRATISLTRSFEDSLLAFLILDTGSSSVRALLYDEQARPAPGLTARRAHPFATSASGAVTTDLSALAEALESCIDAILAHPAASAIEAVAMSTFAGSLTGLDGHGVAITPLYTYADTQPAADAAALKLEVDAKDTHQRTGCRIHSAYQPARLRWLKRTQPDTCSRVAQWCDFSSALYRRWFGRLMPVSHSAAAWSGLLNRSTLTWDVQWLDILDLSEDRLPPLADWRSAQRGLAGEFANRWPALADTPFFLAVGDGAAANFGSAGDSGAPVLTLGTTGAIRLITAQPRRPLPESLWEYCLDSERRLPGGATTEGGSAADWCRHALGLTAAELNTTLARPPDSHGLTALPLFSGERSPNWREDARATLHGLRLESTRLDIAQALLEGVGLRLRSIAAALDVRGQALWAGGGAFEALPAWAQVMADILDSPLKLLAEPEPAARGIALLLAETLTPDFTPAPPPVRAEITPDKRAVAVYEAAAARQAALYRSLYGGPPPS